MYFFEIVLGIFCLSVVVLIHETGHYISARFRGIKILTFSIGFGPRLFGVTLRGTDFRVSLIPLGGYCRFYGDSEFQKYIRENREPDSFSPDSFYGAKPLSRIIVSLWGPLANIIFSLVLFFFIAWTGYEELYSEPRILLASNWNDDGKVWPADEAGLEDGDYILSINGEFIKRFSDLRNHYANMPGKEIELEISRNSENFRVTAIPDGEKKAAVLGILNWLEPVIEEVNRDSPADRAGLSSNDKILSLNEHEVQHTVALAYLLRRFAGSQVEIEVERNGSIETMLLDIPENKKEIGLTFRYLKSRSDKLTPLQAMAKSFDRTWFVISSTFNNLKMLFKGSSFNNSILGPIRLISDTGTIVARGFKRGFESGLLWASELMALISLSLAILNLLPVPVLDGGQISIFTLEFLTRKSIKVKTIYRYQLIGTIIIMLIAFAAITGDLIYILGG